jgi:hypothetical protein
MSVTVNAGEAETVGEPDEGKPHVRFDEGRLGTDRLRGLWRPTRRWVTAGERSSAINAVPHQQPTPQQLLLRLTATARTPPLLASAAMEYC